MARRGELTDAAWARLRPLLPANGKRGGQWRGVATRHEQRAVNYRAGLVIAALLRWLRP